MIVGINASADKEPKMEEASGGENVMPASSSRGDFILAANEGDHQLPLRHRVASSSSNADFQHQENKAPARFFRTQANSQAFMIALYMLVSMSVTLLDKWLITGLGFDAPLSLVMTTYFIMHLVTTLIRSRARRRERHRGEEEGGSVITRRLSGGQWARKVFPVAAVAGLEVGTSALGLQAMQVGVHTMVRSTVPIFVLLFSVGMGLQEFRVGLVVVVFVVSGGVALLFSGQRQVHEYEFPMVGLLLTLLSGMLAGMKWTLSQVLLQGRGIFGKVDQAVRDHIHPFTLVHYMSLSSSATLVPFASALEFSNLRDMAETFSAERTVNTALLIVACSLLALVLILTEFSFIKKVSSLSLCMIGVVKELLLVLVSVAMLGESLSRRTAVGFSITMVGVVLYKLMPKGPPQGGNTGQYEAMPKGNDVTPLTPVSVSPDPEPSAQPLAPHRGGGSISFEPFALKEVSEEVSNVHIVAVGSSACGQGGDVRERRDLQKL